MVTYQLIRRLRSIKALVCDVDGTLTQGWVTYDTDLQPRRFYHIRDGFGLVQLKKLGYKLAWITASKANDISHRVRLLEIDYLGDGTFDKLPALYDFCQKFNLTLPEVAFIGDDVFDLPIIQKVGFSCCVRDADDSIKNMVHYVLPVDGGHGAVRYLCDLLMTWGYYRLRGF